MNLTQLLLILRAHYKVALCVMLATVAIGFATVMLLPKKYTATTSLLVDVKSPDPVTALIMPANLSTQVDIITSERVALRVVRMLGLADSPKVREQWTEATDGKGTVDSWLAALLLKSLQVSPARDSNILSMSFTGSDPAFAAAVVNGFAQAYVDVSIELKVEPSRQYARWFADQGKTLRDNFEKAQEKLSAFQRESGIIAREEQFDTETTRLANLSAELIKVQSEINYARSKQESGRIGDSLPEVMSNPVIAGLRSDINRLEARLQEAGINLGTNHPQYVRMQSELAALKQRLDSEIKSVTGGFSASRAVGTDSAAALKVQVEAQKKKLLEMKKQRDELAVLQRDVDAAKSAYDMVSRRYSETDLASQSTQANVTILTPATAPIEPSFPKPLGKSMLLVVALAFPLGGLSALGIELLNRRIRSPKDLKEVLALPVLGVVTRPIASRSRRKWFRRSMIAEAVS